MMKQSCPSPKPAARVRGQRRRGFTTPAVAIAMLVIMAGLALILDRMWLDSADLELTTAAEAAALAAAGELASDDLMKPDADPELRLELARSSAGLIAGKNVVAGDPVLLDTNPEGDIRLGRLVFDDTAGQVRFEETAKAPNTAVVTALRTRRSSNPVSLFVAGVTGHRFGEVACRVEASVDNRVCGVRPQAGAPVPALPLAIWWRDPSGRRADTWESQIEARRGVDQFGYDSIGRTVYSGSDGIPEIVLHSQAADQPATQANLLVVDIGTGMNDRALARQFASGWTVDDLDGSGGEFRLPAGASRTLRASSELRHADREALEALVGEPRICLLYASATESGGGDLLATCIRMVAIRVLEVRDQGDGSCAVVAQPCVIRTRTALLDVPTPYSTEAVLPVSPYTAAATGQQAPGAAESANPGNPYIYKLHLTH